MIGRSAIEVASISSQFYLPFHGVTAGWTAF
jgi:hypothetical protein